MWIRKTYIEVVQKGVGVTDYVLQHDLSYCAACTLSYTYVLIKLVAMRRSL